MMAPSPTYCAMTACTGAIAMAVRLFVDQGCVKSPDPRVFRALLTMSDLEKTPWRVFRETGYCQCSPICVVKKFYAGANGLVSPLGVVEREVLLQ